MDCDVVLNGDHRRGRAASDGGGAGGGQHPRPGQQGVADHRRARSSPRSRARPDRAGRQRAQRAGPVPARGYGRRGGAGSSSPPAAARSAAAAGRTCATVTPEEALAHPTWDMGPVVTINSATLVNKGLEVIEAHLLFGIPFDRIEVVVHPTSVVHSMVEFVDGSTLAQASPPTMLIPIALGLAWPDRLPDAAPAVDWTTAQTWEFSRSTTTPSPRSRLARQRGSAVGTSPAVYNAANEVCVEAFRPGEMPVHRRSSTRSPRVLEQPSIVSSDPATSLDVGEVMAADAWARGQATSTVGGHRDDRAAVHLGRRALRARGGGLDRPARARPPDPGQDLQRQGHPVLRRLRPHPLVDPARRDRVRRQGDPARRLLQAHRDGPARRRGAAADAARPERSGRDIVRSRSTGMFAQLVSDAKAAEYEHVAPEDHDRLFYNKPWWQRVIIMGSGVAINLVLAFLLFAIAFMAHRHRPGPPRPGRRRLAVRRRGDQEQHRPTAAAPAAPPTPRRRRRQAGFLPGDRIVSFNGHRITDWTQVQRRDPRQRRPAGPTVVVERHGRPLTLHPTTVVSSVTALDDSQPRSPRPGFLGVVPTTAKQRQRPRLRRQHHGHRHVADRRRRSASCRRSCTTSPAPRSASRSVTSTGRSASSAPAGSPARSPPSTTSPLSGPRLPDPGPAGRAEPVPRPVQPGAAAALRRRRHRHHAVRDGAPWHREAARQARPGRRRQRQAAPDHLCDGGADPR